MFPDIPTFNGCNKSSKPPKNPKIGVLIEEIINDGSTGKSPSGGIPKKKVPPDIVGEVFQEKVLPEIVAAVFQEEPSFEVEEQEKSSPRTK